MSQRIAVLGAGLAGLSAAWRLVKHGYTVEVIERDAIVGGLAKSVSYQGFTFDMGPHRFLAPPGSRVLQRVQALLEDDLSLCYRRSRILTRGKYLDYPLQAKSLFASTRLSATIAAMGSFLWSRARWYTRRPPDISFEHWVVNRFGPALYKAHFRDYTTKLWGIPPSEISADWAVQRISLISLWDVLRWLVLPGRQKPRTYATEFHYPAGGIGTIADRLAHEIQQAGGEIALHTTVTGVETHADRVVAVRWADRRSGRQGRTEVDGVISAIPLPELARMCASDSGLEEAITGLRYRSLVLVNLLVKREWITGDHWLYFPEKQYVFNRISEPKSFSPYLVPPERTSVCAEITCDLDDAVWNADPDALVEQVTDALAKLGLVAKAEVSGGFVTKESHEYPVYSLGYREKRTAILAYLSRFANLQTIGRQGLFRYNNMDHSMEMGFAAADTLLNREAPQAQRIAGHGP